MVAGTYQGTLDFDGAGGQPGWVATDNNGPDIFLAKFDGATGDLLWSSGFPGAGSDYPIALAIDSADQIVLAGNFRDGLDFDGPGPLPPLSASPSLLDIFVAKFDANGAPLWARDYGSIEEDRASGVAVDGQQNIVVTGAYGEDIDFDGSPQGNLGRRDLYVLKLDPDGGTIWSVGFGTDGEEEGVDCAVDGAGDIVVTGRFNTALDFGGGLLSVDPGLMPDAFLIKLDSDGAHLWSKSFPAPDAQHGMAVAVAPTDPSHVVAAGLFEGTVNLGGQDLTWAGAEDVFVAKFNP